MEDDDGQLAYCDDLLEEQHETEKLSREYEFYLGDRYVKYNFDNR